VAICASLIFKINIHLLTWYKIGYNCTCVNLSDFTWVRFCETKQSQTICLKIKNDCDTVRLWKLEICGNLKPSFFISCRTRKLSQGFRSNFVLKSARVSPTGTVSFYQSDLFISHCARKHTSIFRIMFYTFKLQSKYNILTPLILQCLTIVKCLTL